MSVKWLCERAESELTVGFDYREKVAAAVEAFRVAGVEIYDHANRNTLVTREGEIRLIDFALDVDRDMTEEV